MATKMFCNRCGAEINLLNCVAYKNVQRVDYSDTIRLCVSCAHKLKLWLNGKKEESDK